MENCNIFFTRHSDSMVACNPLYLDMEQCSEQVVTNWFLKQFNGILDSKIFIFPFLHDTIWFLFVIDTSAKDFYFFRGVEHKHLGCHSNIIRPYFERLKILFMLYNIDLDRFHKKKLYSTYPLFHCGTFSVYVVKELSLRKHTFNSDDNDNLPICTVKQIQTFFNNECIECMDVKGIDSLLVNLLE